MTTTTTADELGTEIISKAARIRELSTSAEELEKSLTSGRDVIARAIAGGSEGAADEARASVRIQGERLSETQSAIELLTRERINLETRRKHAEAREAAENVSLLSAEAATAIGSVSDAVMQAARTIAELASDGRHKIDQANRADQIAASLNGRPWSMPRFGWSSKPGLSDVLDALDHYQRTVRGDFTVRTS